MAWKKPSTYHEWGDDSWPYWSQLDEACSFIHWFCTRIGRFGGQIKEKYGALRFYAHFHYQLHDLAYPGYCWIRWSLPFRQLDSLYMRYFPTLLKRPIWAWQSMIYRLAYRLAAARWPMIYHEIYAYADYYELLAKDYIYNYSSTTDAEEDKLD